MVKFEFLARNFKHCDFRDLDNQELNFFCSWILKSLKSSTEWPLITYLRRRIDKSLLSTWEIPEIQRNIFLISTFLLAILDCCYSDQMCLLVVSTKAESRDTNYERKYEKRRRFKSVDSTWNKVLIIWRFLSGKCLWSLMVLERVQMGPEEGSKIGSRKSSKSETIPNSKMSKVNHSKCGINVQKYPEVV